MALVGHGAFKIYGYCFNYITIKTIIKDKYFRFQTWVSKNVSDEVLLAWLKFQAKIPSRSGVYVKWKWQKILPVSPPLSKSKGQWDTDYSMSIANLILGVSSVTVSHLIHYDSLLQNTTLLQTAAAILLLNVTEVYYKIHQIFYYKSEIFIIKCELLKQNATFIANCDSTTWKRYKIAYPSILMLLIFVDASLDVFIFAVIVKFRQLLEDLLSLLLKSDCCVSDITVAESHCWSR